MKKNIINVAFFVGIIFLLITIIFFGCIAYKILNETETDKCKQIDIVELGNADCDVLLRSYKCCSDTSITVFNQGNCDRRYSSLIAKRCD